MKKTPLVAVILITSLFFFWGFALDLTPILIRQSEKGFQPRDTHSTLRLSEKIQEDNNSETLKVYFDNRASSTPMPF